MNLYENKSFISALANQDIYLQVLSLEDAEDIYFAITHSFEHLMKYPATIPWILNEQSLENTKLYCLNVISNLPKNQEIVFVIRQSHTHNFIGLVGLHNICWEISKLEIGFWGNSAFSKRGLMRKAVQLLICMLQEHYDFTCIEAYVDQENKDARILCEKSGFQLDTLIQNGLKNPIDNTFRNLCVYRVLRLQAYSP